MTGPPPSQQTKLWSCSKLACACVGPHSQLSSSGTQMQCLEIMWASYFIPWAQGRSASPEEAPVCSQAVWPWAAPGSPSNNPPSASEVRKKGQEIRWVHNTAWMRWTLTTLLQTVLFLGDRPLQLWLTCSFEPEVDPAPCTQVRLSCRDWWKETPQSGKGVLTHRESASQTGCHLCAKRQGPSRASCHFQ